MKTLIVTSIYANLWGSEYGGRSSRYHHYRISLLNMMNMKPNKVICFTSSEEYEDLKTFFYSQHGFNEEKIEFRIFNLSDSKYFDVIKSKKNIESMKTFDRCFEIQYDKFFWVENLKEINEYDRVYWFDAGLSHSGLFPDCFAFGNTYERNFQFNVFNNKFLEKINNLTEDKFVLVCKNNTGAYYWSTSIPEKYYENYSKNLHVVGGFFGGKPEKYLDVVKQFDSLLSKLLLNENTLYMEEQILSCLLYQNENFYTTLVFDDWYKKENYVPGVRLFYELFITDEDCNNQVTNTTEIEEVKKEIELKDINELELLKKNNSIVIVSTCLVRQEINEIKNLINSVITNTEFDYILLTEFYDDFGEIENDRIKLINYSDYFSDEKFISGFQNFHLKRYIISIAKNLNYDYIIFCDSNTVLTGWDENSFYKFLTNDFDISFIRNADSQLGYLKKEYEHYNVIIENEFNGFYEDSLNRSPNPESSFFIIKNGEKINLFLDYWNEINQINNNRFPTYFHGVYLGVLSVKSDFKMIGITKENEFTNFINYKKNNDLFDFYGQKIN